MYERLSDNGERRYKSKYIQVIWKIMINFSQLEWTKLRRKILYHFIILAIVNKILMLKILLKIVENWSSIIF